MWDLSTNKLNWLVVEPPLWKIWKSVGMMTFRIYGTNHLTNKCTPLQYFEVVPSAIAFAQNCMINQEVFSTARGPIQSAKPKPVGNRWLTNAKRSTRNNKARLVPEQGNKHATFAADWVNILYLFISQWFPIHGKNELHCPSSWCSPYCCLFISIPIIPYLCPLNHPVSPQGSCIPVASPIPARRICLKVSTLSWPLHLALVHSIHLSYSMVSNRLNKRQQNNQSHEKFCVHWSIARLSNWLTFQLWWFHLVKTNQL